MPIHWYMYVSIRLVDMQFIQDCSVNRDTLYHYFQKQTTCLDKMLPRMHVIILFELQLQEFTVQNMKPVQFCIGLIFLSFSCDFTQNFCNVQCFLNTANRLLI